MHHSHNAVKGYCIKAESIHSVFRFDDCYLRLDISISVSSHVQFAKFCRAFGWYF